MTDGDDCGTVDGMNVWQGSRSTRRKPDPVPLWPPEIPNMTNPGLEPVSLQWESARSLHFRTIMMMMMMVIIIIIIIQNKLLGV
jgi:hypothetical protein